MAIDVRLSSTWDAKGINQAVKDINAIKSQLGSIEAKTKAASDNFGAFGGSIKKLGATAAAVFGAQQITQFFSSSIQGAIQDEKSLRVLNKTLANMGFASAATQVDGFIQKLQYSAGIADDQLRPALNNLVIATGSVSDSQKLLQLGLDVSAGSGRDLDTITVALAKAFNGNYTALKKLNLGIDESLIKNKDFAAIQDVLAKKFAGASANAVDTYAGKLAVLKLGVDDAKEAIGYGLLKAVENISDALGLGAGGMASKLADVGYELGKFFEGIGIAVVKLIEWKQALDQTDSPFGKFINRTIEAVGNVAKLAFDLTGIAQIFKFFTKQVDDQSRSQAENNRWQAQADFWLKQKVKTTETATVVDENYKKAQEELKKSTQSLIDINKSYAQFVAGTSPQSVEGATALAQEALQKIQTVMSNHPKVNQTLVDSFKQLASVVQTNLSYALDQAKTKLEAAKQQYNSFKDTIQSAISGVMDFTNIQEGSTFLDSLQEQAKKAQTFGSQIQQLLTMGLNQTALTQIANAGYETGTVIADQIIKGGSTVVDQVNTLTASVTSVADQVSTSLADQFYAAGVNAAQNLVDALITKLNESAAIIAAAIANATKGQTTATDTSKSGKKSTKKRALGGNVFPNTSYIVGERGPELFMPSTMGNIVPNNQLASKAGASINIVVNAGMGTNGAQVGKDIVEAIKKYERASGQVFASA